MARPVNFINLIDFLVAPWTGRAGAARDLAGGPTIAAWRLDRAGSECYRCAVAQGRPRRLRPLAPRAVQPAPPAPVPAPSRDPRSALRIHAQGRARPLAWHRDPRPIRHDIVDRSGSVTLREAVVGLRVLLVAGQLHHIGVGRTHAPNPRHPAHPGPRRRVINATTGELLRELTIDTTRDYQSRTPK
jgi:hypothetical protein